MRQPRDLGTTMVGLMSIMMLAYIQPIVDAINNRINSWWAFPGFLKQWLTWFVTAAAEGLNRLFYGAPNGALDWFAAAPNAFDQLTTSIVQSLASHNQSIIWLVNYDVPKAYHGAQQYTNYVAWQQGNWILQIQASILNQLFRAYSLLSGAMSQMQSFLLGQINGARADAFNYTTSRWLDARNFAAYLYNQSVAFTNQVGTNLYNYTNQVQNNLNNRITATAAALSAALGAAVAYITLTFVPAEITASVALQNGLATEAMAVTWEVMATKANLNLAEWAIMDPGLTWATDPTPEVPPVGIALGLGELVNFARRSMDVESNTLIPLYRNLHQFGQDLSSLSGVVTDVLLAGFTVAAVTDPGGTAALVADTIGGPLNELGTSIVNALLG